MKICIIGAGALGVQLAHLAIKCGFIVKGFFDDYQPIGSIINSIPILGEIAAVEKYYKDGFFSHLLCGIGYKHFQYRENIFNTFFYEKGIPFATLIDSSCIIDSTALIAPGTVLYPGCIIDKNVVIGNNVLINLGVCISHNTKIGHHSYLSPECAIAGNVEIKDRCFIGINSTIVDDVKILNDVVIAAGAVVTSDCNNRGLYAGVPAIFKKQIVNFN